MYYEYDDIGMEDAKKEIKTYVDSIHHYLTHGKMDVKTNQYMKTYSCIVKLCDVDDLAPDLYAIY